MQIVKRTFLATFLVVAVAGCDRMAGVVANEVAKLPEPTLVISPGYKVQIDGVATAVFGFDVCPKEAQGISAFFGPAPNDGSTACIVLEKGRESVRVRYKTVTGLKEESWQIVRGEVEKYGTKFPTTALQRPDGTYVVPATNS